MTEKIKANPIALKLKINYRVRITEYENIFIKGYTENMQREICIIDSYWKTNHWTNKIKDLNGEK